MQIGSKLTMSLRHSKFVTLKTIVFALYFLQKRKILRNYRLKIAKDVTDTLKVSVT